MPTAYLRQNIPPHAIPDTHGTKDMFVFTKVGVQGHVSKYALGRVSPRLSLVIRQTSTHPVPVSIVESSRT